MHLGQWYISQVKNEEDLKGDLVVALEEITKRKNEYRELKNKIQEVQDKNPNLTKDKFFIVKGHVDEAKKEGKITASQLKKKKE